MYTSIVEHVIVYERHYLELDDRPVDRARRELVMAVAIAILVLLFFICPGSLCVHLVVSVKKGTSMLVGLSQLKDFLFVCI